MLRIRITLLRIRIPSSHCDADPEPAPLRSDAICDHWSTDTTRAHFYFEPPQLVNFDFDADPAFHSAVDPDPAFHSAADPDPASQKIRIRTSDTGIRYSFLPFSWLLDPSVPVFCWRLVNDENSRIQIRIRMRIRIR